MVNGISGYTVSKAIEQPARLPAVVRSNATQASVQEKLPSQERTPMTDEQIQQKLIETTQAMNHFLGSMKTSLKFEMHEGLEKMYVSIVDAATGDVLKEIPSKKLLDMYASMAENMALFVDRRI